MAKKYEFKPDKPYSGFWEKLFLTRLQRKGLMKWSLYALSLLFLSVVQDVLLSRVRILGVTTELVPCAIFLICLLEGLEKGSIFALTASLFYLFSGTAAGVYTIVFITALAVGVTWLRQSWLQGGFGAAMLCTGLAMVAYELVTCAFGAFLGLTSLVRVGSFLLCAAMTLLTAPAMYPVFKAIGGSEIWRE